MNIPLDQIEFKRKIGKAGNRNLFHYKLKGGLHLIAGANGEVLGTGPACAVARHICARHAPDAVWDELSKSEYQDPSTFQHLLPEYEAITDSFRKLQGK